MQKTVHELQIEERLTDGDTAEDKKKKNDLDEKTLDKRPTEIMEVSTLCTHDPSAPLYQYEGVR